MTIRTTRHAVTFARPFFLSGIGEEQPAGTYTVETDEEMLDTATAPAFRRLTTVIRLPGRPGSMVLEQIVDIDHAELKAALDKDNGAPP